MSEYEHEAMVMSVRYNKGGKKNGYLPEDFQRPPDWEHEYSEEDEVFVESPNIDKDTATKPLMYPRSRTKSRLGRGPLRKCRPVINAVCCFLFLVLSLGSLMGLVVYFVNKHEKNKSVLQDANKLLPSAFKFVKDKQRTDFSNIVGCDNIQVEDVWTLGLPKLLTESAFRLVDVNQDGILDIIVGFATGADGYNIPSIVCDIYFDGTYPCFGGLIALEGATGKELWRHYSDHEIYGVNCGADLNKDGVIDCLAGGRAGAFQAVSGKNGALLWNFGKQEAKNDIMNLYTAQIIPDLDGDSTVDILAIHGGDPLQDPGSKYRLSGRILLMSGLTGKVIRFLGVPDGRESYYSPQLYTWTDGTRLVLFGTGGETHGGSLWVVKLDDLISGSIDKAIPLYTDPFKGVMTPPVLVDITDDGVEDIIVPVFNSSLLAFNGQTFKIVWNYTQSMSESYNTPAPGFYNDDDVPDFLIKYAHGPGFPVYYHSTTTIIDGRTGKPLIDPPMRDTVGAQASAVTVSMEGRGNDVFLYWVADCLDHEGQGGEFKFVEGTNVHEQSRSDFCRLRFKTKGYSKIYALGQHTTKPGITVYYSEDRAKVEHGSWVNTTKEGIEFVMSHQEYLDEYERFMNSERNADYENVDALIPEEQGSESLFETPVIPDSARTTYKKGPPTNKHKARPINVDGIKQNPVPDYEYPYYDQVMGLKGSPLGSDRVQLNNFQGLNNDFDSYYQTTQRSPYTRSRYRTKSPPSNKPKQSRNTNIISNTDITNDQVKPIAMRDASTRNKRSDVYMDIKRDTSNFSRRSSVSSGTAHKTGNRKKKHTKGYDNRKRRHVGPHDEDGLQRLLSTGSLVPTLLSKDHPNYNHSIDFVFATYWFFPAKTRAILPEDQHCIENKMSEETIRFDPKSEYYGMDHDAYEHAITDDCLAKGKHDLPDDGTYESQTQYNPFNIHMGQMTVYRLRLTCTCSNQTLLEQQGKRCGQVLPFQQQQWFAYMGNNADSHWIPRADN